MPADAMTVLAHIAGIPVEEALPALYGGAGVLWVALRTSFGARVRARVRRRPGGVR